MDILYKENLKKRKKYLYHKEIEDQYGYNVSTSYSRKTLSIINN